MNLKLCIPPVKYTQIKPGQIFTDKWCKKLFLMSSNKENPLFKLGETKLYEALEITEEGYRVRETVKYENTSFNTVTETIFEDNSPL